MPEKRYIENYFTLTFGDGYYARIAKLNSSGRKKYDNKQFYVDNIRRRGTDKLIKSKREIKKKMENRKWFDVRTFIG